MVQVVDVMQWNRFERRLEHWNMTCRNTLARHLALVVFLWTILAPCCLRARDSRATARELALLSGVEGGLVVHVGCGDGHLTEALRLSDSYVVHGLDTDPKRIQQTRSRLQESGRYGPIAVDVFDGDHLPYSDGIVNLLVVDTPAQAPMNEMMRVLAPGGVACIQAGNHWARTVKPWPDGIDHWPHYLHGRDNNAVARDTTVGPPRSVQWIGGPMYARSHEINSSMGAMVTAGGRLFYIWDSNPTGMTERAFPSNWQLIARDAFNGLILWRRPMPEWGWRQWHTPERWNDPKQRALMLRHLPATLPRRLVAAADRLYTTLGYNAPVSVLDAATGRQLQHLEHTALTDEILLCGDTLVLRVRLPESPPERNVWGGLSARQRACVVAVNANSGKILWRSEPDDIAPLTLATAGTQVVYSNYERVVCLELADGSERWRSDPVVSRTQLRGTVGTLVAQEHVILYAHPPRSGGGQAVVHAFAAATGEILWQGPRYVGPGVANPPDLFVIDGLVWIGETTIPVDVMQTELSRQGLDLGTGRASRNVSVPRLISAGHHYRCYRSKATARYLLLPKRGVEFVDLLGSNHMRHDWLRAPCIYGMLPANGLLYVGPHQCVCYPGVLLASFNALSPRPFDPDAAVGAADRLRPGPAYRTPVSTIAAGPRDWPAYRHDPRRTGVAGTEVPQTPVQRWSHAMGNRLTPPIVAGGRLLVADKTSHTVHALDAAGGTPLWRFTAGARIDSPPTVHQDLVLFGSTDGCVYGLQLEDGRERWRFLAAPCDRRVPVRGQLESAWPVHGSVLIQADHTVQPPRAVAYVTAGRSTFLDGGIRVYGLDPRTGKMLHQTVLSGPRADPVADVGGAGYMDGAKTDLLVSDGGDIYLFQERLSTDLQRYPSPMESLGREGGGFRIFPAAPERAASGTRLIATGGFLDDNYNEGHHWTYADRWPGWDRKMHRVQTPYGQLLVVDDHGVYGMHAFHEDVRVRRGLALGGKGYRLFARDHGAASDRWSIFVPVRVRAMVLAAGHLFIAGPPDELPADDPLAAVQGRRGALLWTVAATDGAVVATQSLPAPPVFDGMIAANNHLYITTTDNRILCLGPE